MGLRIHRVTDEQWQRLVASRRGVDLSAYPARASISAIEVELRSLDHDLSDVEVDLDEPRQAAAG